tara:strand:+ start:37 stop:774 length:738 start_codon:yes stop_codon:yes gene_type:complete
MIFTNNINVNTNVNAIYFIHIPKTSGLSLKSKKIIKLGHKYNVTGVKGNGFYKFPKESDNTWLKYSYPEKNNLIVTIIRNPFDLLCSYYFHGEELKKNGEFTHSGWDCVNFIHQFKSFKEFISAYCNKNFKWHHPTLKNFLFSQLFNEKHVCVPDIIIKYEYLNDAIKILNKKGFKIKPQKHINKSVRKQFKYTTYYDKEMIKKVNKKCKRELQTFKYNFQNDLSSKYFILKPTVKYSIFEDKIY